MSRFPHLPETFILREMNGMAELGWDIVLYPLVLQDQVVIHPEAKAWFDRARSLSLTSWDAMQANGRYFFKNPRRFLSIWMRTIKENLSSPNYLLRALVVLPKAAYAADLMEKEGVSHIHAHYASHPALAAWAIYKLTGIPYSITVHAHDIFVRKAMLKTKLQDATFIAAISQFNRKYLADYAGEWVTDKIEIVHCGIDPSRYQSHPSNRVSLDQPLEMITIGSLQPYKGQKYLVNACAYLQKWGIPFRCRVIGEGEERAHLEKLIADHNLQDCFELLGAKTQEEVALLLATAHCYIQPSVITPAGKMEGIPVSIMEALACALPVVATNISGIPEIIQDGETGYLVSPEDSMGLAKAVAKIYQEYEVAINVAKAGQRLVFREFDLTSNVNLLASLFERQSH